MNHHEYVIDGLAGVVRAQHGCRGGVARWDGGDQNLSRCLEFIFRSWMFLVRLEIVCPRKVDAVQRE